MKNYMKFEYSQDGIRDLQDFTLGGCTDFKKMRSPNAVGECMLNGVKMYEGSFAVRKGNTFVIVKSQPRVGL